MLLHVGIWAAGAPHIDAWRVAITGLVADPDPVRPDTYARPRPLRVARVIRPRDTSLAVPELEIAALLRSLFREPPPAA
jgi:hypothetical protein